MARRWFTGLRSREDARVGSTDVDTTGRQDVERIARLLASGRHASALELARSCGPRLPAPAVDVLTGAAFAGLGRAIEAIDALQGRVAAAAADATLLGAFLDALPVLGTGPEVEGMARELWSAAPDSAGLAFVIGRCCLARGAPQEAEPWLRRTVEQHPLDAAAWSAAGLALRQQDRDAEALAAYEAAERATAAGGQDVEAFADIAYVLQRMGRLDDARAVLEAGLPNSPSIGAHRGYAEVLLTLGELAAGFDEYEFRWMAEPLAASRLGPVRPPWRGQPLAGKTILLRVEQGYGDTFQFLRYARHVKRLGATVVMRRFCDLVDAMPEIDVALRDGDPVPDFDYYANLGSLPRVFGTTLDTVPAAVPYLRAPAGKPESWRMRIGPSDALKVGLVWAGNALPDPRRSIALPDLAPLLDVARVQFFGLQKGIADHEIVAATDGRIRPLGALLADFGDTAAAIGALDLVISIDTSVAHLAGALGKPVWTLLVQNADWRWMSAREDSPWYPSMRLFRQKVRGDWTPVIERVARALSEVADGRRVFASTAGDRIDVLPAPRPVAKPPLGSKFSRVVESRYGIVHHCGDDSIESIGLDCYGEHLQSQLALLERWVGAGAAVLDVAPGAGAHVLALASILGTSGRQVLVERRAFEQQLLRQTLRANRIGQTMVLDAVPDLEDDLPGALELARLDLLKIGEGADAAATLARCDPLIWRFRPVIFAAVPESGDLVALMDALRHFGYCAWRIETPLFNPDNFFGRPDDLFNGRRAVAIAAAPEESARPLLDEPPLLSY